MKTDYKSRKDWAQRYIKRKANSKIGWADQDSYKTKEERIDSFLDRHPLPKGSRFLELGCGAGNITLFVAKKGFETHGIDIVPEAIRWAKEKMTLSNTKADFKIGNILDLNCYSDNYFDFIVDGETLHSIINSDRKRCLTSIFRVLKKGGYFLAGANLVNEKVTTSSDSDQESYFDPRTRCLYHNNVPYYYLSQEQEFLSEIKEAGFQIEYSQKSPRTINDAPFQAGWLWVDSVKP